MSLALSVAAAKWARAVRNRQAAASALRKAKLAAQDAAFWSRDRALEDVAAKFVAEAKRNERRAEKALLALIEKDARAGDVENGVQFLRPLAVRPNGAGEVIDV